MRVKEIKDEDFVNYKVPSMFVATCFCDFKCPRELGLDISICQNEPIVSQPIIEVSAKDIFLRYTSNPITQAICFGGLEPIRQFVEMFIVINYFRSHGVDDDVVIYTGYYESEISQQIGLLSQFENIAIKFGRFKPNEKPHRDPILGVDLISNNQYARRIS